MTASLLALVIILVALLLIALALLAYMGCVTREDGRELARLEAEREWLQGLLIEREEQVADLKARQVVMALDLRDTRRVRDNNAAALRETDAALRLALACLGRAAVDAEDEAAVEQFRAELDALDGGAA